MRAQMLDELRDVVQEMKRLPHAKGPKTRFESLVRQMTTSERAELRDTLRDMLLDASEDGGTR
jgi:hypothetical protein